MFSLKSSSEFLSIWFAAWFNKHSLKKALPNIGPPKNKFLKNAFRLVFSQQDF